MHILPLSRPSSKVSCKFKKKLKVRWELNKNAICCFEQILEATHDETASVQLFISHLINQVRTIHAGHCW